MDQEKRNYMLNRLVTLSTRIYQSNIQLQITEKIALNAEAHWQKGTIKFGEELMECSSPEELEVVLAHELGHIALRPFSRRDLIPTKLQFAIIILMIVFTITAYWRHWVPDWLWPIGFLLISIIGFIRFDKENLREELRADLLASILLENPSVMKNFLKKQFAEFNQKLAKKRLIWRLINFWRIFPAKHAIQRRIDYLESLIRNQPADFA